MERPRNTIFIIIVIFAIAVFAGLNVAMGRIGMDPEKARQEAAQAAAEKAASADKAPNTPTPPGAPPSAPLPTDESMGPANAKDKIVVGWTWTPDVQGNPQALQAAVEAIRKAAPDAQVRVVNVDAVPDAPTGIVVNGQQAMELPDNGIIEAAAAVPAVMAARSSNKK